VKTPPPPDVQVPAAPAVSDRRDARFLVFVAAVLVALALGFKSELIAPGQVWILGAGLVTLAAPALLAYLRSDQGPPAVEHFIPVALGAVAVAGLSAFPLEGWQYGVITLLFGLGFISSSWLDRRRLHARDKPGHVVLQETAMVLALAGAFLVVVTLNLPLALRLAWIFTIALLATYRSFRALGQTMSPRRAFLFGLVVAQLVTSFGWAMYYLNFQEGPFAALLIFFWYVNRGLIRHTAEETLSRNVLLEYGMFAVLLAVLFYESYTPRPS
jgi:hypothetical protein